jgi:hypothetical protein
MSEQQTQQQIRLARRWLFPVARCGYGATTPARWWLDRQGRPVTFGLCKGSSDLIGLRSVTIGPEHVGQTLAVFVAVEVKSAQGRTTAEQGAFIEQVTAMGGLAGVARTVGEAAAILDLT